MTLTDVLKLARRFWWVFVLCPLVAAGAAYLVSRAITPVYRARSIVVVEDQPSNNSSTYNDILAAERRASTFSRLAEARPVLIGVIARLQLDTSPEQLAEHVTVAPAPATQLLTVSVTDSDPATSAAIANAVAQEFIAQTTAQQRASGGSGSAALQANVATVTQNIDTAAARIDELRSSPNAGSAAAQAEIAGVQSQLNQLQTTYSTLLETQQRMDLAESQVRTQLRVAEDAVAPSSPILPRVKRTVALGGALGVLLAGGLALLFGFLDNTIKTAEDARRLLGVRALGNAPTLHSPVGLIALSDPHSASSEAYRALRTNLQFAVPGRKLRSIAITSLRPGEGKTTTIANLAIALAQSGQRVVLVDGDVRKPRLHRVFEGLSNRYGLTNLLPGMRDEQLSRALQPTQIENLTLLSAGPLPPNAADLLNSDRLRQVVELLEEVADIVLLDAPPLAVSDALLLAGAVDGVALVTIGGTTRAHELAHAIDDIGRTGAVLLGVIVHRAKSAGNSYGRYREYYAADTAENAPPRRAPSSPFVARRGE